MIDLEYVLIIVLHESKCVFSQSCFKVTDIVVDTDTDTDTDISLF